MQQFIPIIPVFGRLRPEDCYKFNTSLGYRVRPYLKHTERRHVLSS